LHKTIGKNIAVKKLRNIPNVLSLGNGISRASVLVIARMLPSSSKISNNPSSMSGDTKSKTLSMSVLVHSEVERSRLVVLTQM
jgi:hypothetical protein